MYTDTVVLVVFRVSGAMRAKTCADLYGNVMTQLCAGSLAHGKANRFLDSSLVLFRLSQFLDRTKSEPELAPSLR